MTTAVASGQLTEEQQRVQLAREWGGFLDRYEWTYFSTLTFERPPSADSAARAFGLWVRRIESVGCQRVSWVYFVERSRAGTIHLHSLLNTPPRITAETLDYWWTGGWNEHSPYDRNRGAAAYIAKEMNTTRLEEYDISAKLKAYAE